MGLADLLDGYGRTRTYADGTVVRILIHRTDRNAYPSGWRYTLHYGRVHGTGPDTLRDGTILRYDNAHEKTIGHECHRGRTGEVESVDFEGIEAIWRSFWDDVPKQEFDVGREG